MSCSRSLFWGDVVADDDYQVEFDDGGGVPFQLTFGKGTWFASPYAFWLYVQDMSTFGPFLDYFNEDANGDTFIVFLTNITVTWISGTGNMPTEVGAVALAAAAQTEAWPYCWNTTFQPYDYKRGVDVYNGTSQRAQDGTAYTVAGVPHENRTLAMVLDRRTGTYEAAKWLNLHRNLLRRGRSIAFYLDSITGDDGMGAEFWRYLGGFTYAYGDSGTGRFESLVLPQAGEVKWRPKRLVEAKETVDLEDGQKFYLRQPVPVSDPTARLGRVM